MSNFKLTRTGDTEWCALDEESGVCVLFTEQRYNETNHVVPGQRMRERVEEMGAGEAATYVAHAVMEIGQWLGRYHGDVLHAAPHGIKYVEGKDGIVVLYRNKAPRFEITIRQTGGRMQLSRQLDEAARGLSDGETGEDCAILAEAGRLRLTCRKIGVCDWTLEAEEGVDRKKLASAMKKCAAWLRHAM